MQRFLIHETGIHFVDVFRYLLGEVESVSAQLARLNPVISGEDAGIVVFQFAGGARAVFDANRLVDHAAENTRLTMGEMLVEGSRGTLRLDGDGKLYQRAHGERPEAPVEYEWSPRGFGGDCVYRLQKHVIEHLTRGAPLVNEARDYLENLRTEQAIYRSHTEGRTVRLRRPNT